MMYRTQTFLAALLLAVSGVNAAWAADAPGPIEVTFFHNGYVVHKEDDGLGGDGVDLYMGWVVTTENQMFGDTTPVMGGLTNANGDPINADGTGNRKIHRYKGGQPKFSVVIPANGIAVVRIHMIESDQTTDAIKAKFREARLPVYSQGKSEAQVKVDTNPVAMLLDMLAAFATALKPLLPGHNTDDDYGHWTVEMQNVNGAIKATAITDNGGLGAGCKIDPAIPILQLDGKRQQFLGLYFEDKENAISTGFEAVAQGAK